MNIQTESADAIARFWAKVDKSGECWIWTAGRDRDGYGCAHFSRKPIRAHRASWILTNGSIPDDKPCVLHRCDNPPCVRPDHLWVGTTDDNNKDMAAKGRVGSLFGDESFARRHPDRLARGDRHGSRTHPERVRRGEAHRSAKLTDPQVREIVRRLDCGERQQSLADEYGVARSVVSKISRRQIWRHITDPITVAEIAATVRAKHGKVAAESKVSS